jgi:seryl-tRNA synthetase
MRQDPDKVKKALEKRGIKSQIIDEMLAYDSQRRSLTQDLELLQFERNQASKKIGEMLRLGHSVAELSASVKQIGQDIQEKGKAMQALEDLFQALHMNLPNLPHESVPLGEGEQDNLELRKVGTPRVFEFTPRSHDELGKINNTIDFERAARLSGNKFALLTGEGAYYSRSLMNLMINSARERGYKEINPPFIGKRCLFEGSGQLPKFEEDLYKIEGEDTFLIPTGEVPLVNLFREEILRLDQLPCKMVAYTPCFRKEAGAAGKESKGLIRLHQFEKVELVWLCLPEHSFQALEELTLDAEAILQKLKLPYRVVSLCTGDMSGFSTAKTYDIEVWFPSLGKYLEISSCSNCTDFQARRAQIRYKAQTGKNHFLHTLNGSALAIGRCLAAVMENYQEADGSIAWPDVLK